MYNRGTRRGKGAVVSMLTFEDRTGMLSRNVGTQLPIYATLLPGASKISIMTVVAAVKAMGKYCNIGLGLDLIVH